ncbi:MAG: hypothetical protein NTZ67_03210 [Gammaproteobacteria bacterium]|nr:hypothetical protein [Gammaproteobacteria bacterium]
MRPTNANPEILHNDPIPTPKSLLPANSSENFHTSNSMLYDTEGNSPEKAAAGCNSFDNKHGEIFIVSNPSNLNDNSAIGDPMKNSNVTLQASASTKILNATQKSFLAEYGPPALRILNVFYSFVVSLSFATLTLVALLNKEGLWKVAAYICALCSFANNFPMAIAFNEDLVTDYIANMPGKSGVFKFIAVTSALIGLTTVAVGVKLNEEAASGLLKDWKLEADLAQAMTLAFIAVGAINTFATRSVSVARILNWIYQTVREFYLNRKPEYKPYFQLLSDIEIYGDRIGLNTDIVKEEVKDKTPSEFITWFYLKVDKLLENENVGRTNKQLAALRVKQASGITLAFLAFIMMPSWVGISQSGATAIATFLGWGNKLEWEKAASPLELIAATGSEALYINSAARYPQRVIDYIGRLSSKHNALVATVIAALLIAMSLGSGVGMYGANEKQENPAPVPGSNTTDVPLAGYGTLADSTFFRVLFFKDFFELVIASWAPFLAGTLAGVCTNGGSVMSADQAVDDRRASLKAAGVKDASYWQGAKAYMTGADVDSRVYQIITTTPDDAQKESCKNGNAIFFERKADGQWTVHFSNKNKQLQSVDIQSITESQNNSDYHNKKIPKNEYDRNNNNNRDIAVLNGVLEKEKVIVTAAKNLEEGMVRKVIFTPENPKQLRKIAARLGANTHADALQKGKEIRNKQKPMHIKLKDKIQEAIDKSNESGCEYAITHSALNEEQKAACAQGKKIIFERVENNEGESWYVHYCDADLQLAKMKITEKASILTLNQFVIEKEQREYVPENSAQKLGFQEIAKLEIKYITAEKHPVSALTDVISEKRMDLTVKEKEAGYYNRLKRVCFSFCSDSKSNGAAINDNGSEVSLATQTRFKGYGT